jgi:hypothetical protein
MKGEHFLPFRRSDVVTMCADQVPAGGREEFLAFSQLLSSVVHHQFHGRIEAIKDNYHPFHPQADTRIMGSLDKAARETLRSRLEEELTQLALDANYVQMSHKDIEEALLGSSLIKLKLHIDMDDADKVLLFRRGESEETRDEKRFFGLWRKTVKFIKYARVLVYVKFKEVNGLTPHEVAKLPYKPGSIIVKLFQNVPREDLEMIFPNVRIRMRPLDMLLIGVPALISGIVVVVTKLFTVLGLIFTLIAFWIGLKATEPTIKQASLVAMGIGIFAVASYAWRQFNNFKNRKIGFMKALSENLYYRNLDNDAGVFHHLLDAAEEAEVIEALLAYHFLRQAGGPLTMAELDQRVEQWFSERWQTDFDFEVDDGLDKLRDLDLVTTTTDGRYSAVPIDEALRRLDRLWDNAYVYGEPATVQQTVIPRPAPAPA